jgi:hypothetical protein
VRERLEAAARLRSVSAARSKESTLSVGATGYYDPEDHLPCDYADPQLGIEWPAEPEILSELDQNAPSLAWLVERIERWQPQL